MIWIIPRFFKGVHCFGDNKIDPKKYDPVPGPASPQRDAETIFEFLKMEA
jgi:hypothetical protein